MTLFVFEQTRLHTALGLVVAALFSLNACSSPQAPAASPADDVGRDADASEPGGALTDAELPAFEIVQHKDVSYDFGPGDSAQRLVLRVEIPEWPVTKEQLEALAERLVEEERGNGWQAISISMGADRDESVPAYGVFEWAPEGDWGRASEGDADTWAGYQFSIEWGEKMSNPEEAGCVKPPPIAFQYNKELWAAGMSKSEKQIIRDIATRHDDSPAHVRKLLEDVLEWEFC